MLNMLKLGRFTVQLVVKYFINLIIKKIHDDDTAF